MQEFNSISQNRKNIFFIVLRHVAANCISLAATFSQKSPARSFRCVFFSAKGHAAPVNALATLRLASNLFWGRGGSISTMKMPKHLFHVPHTRRRKLTPLLLPTGKVAPGPVCIRGGRGTKKQISRNIKCKQAKGI